MTLFSMGTVVLCHKWLRKQGKLDVQINVSWLKGEKNIIKIQELTLYQSPTCHRTNTEIPNKSPAQQTCSHAVSAPVAFHRPRALISQGSHCRRSARRVVPSTSTDPAAFRLLHRLSKKVYRGSGHPDRNVDQICIRTLCV